MKASRTGLLKVGLAGGAQLALPFSASACSSLERDLTGRLLHINIRLPKPFEDLLPVSPVLEPVRSDGDVNYYQITQKVGKADVLPDSRQRCDTTTESSPVLPSRQGAQGQWQYARQTSSLFRSPRTCPGTDASREGSALPVEEGLETNVSGIFVVGDAKRGASLIL